MRDDLLVQGIEAICVEIKKVKSKLLLIATCYRPPNSATEISDKFENFLYPIENEIIDLTTTGDLDCDLLASNADLHTKKLTDLLNMYQLQQHIKNLTRTTIKH